MYNENGGEKMNNSESENKNNMQEKLVRWGTFAVIVLIAFLIGLVPMWLNARNIAAEHEVTKKLLVKEEINNSLMRAVIDARLGEYESARQSASSFFSRLRAEIDKEKESAYSADEIGKLKNIFDNRDSTITMLAQRDQASVERLTDIFQTYRQAAAAAKPVTVPEAVNAPANLQ